ncbi:hypothetical protein DTO021C3_6965 [Paecilomyces variotii]|nr:hypothetical protein DTO021C3_6965 [Paecilomyces variotii]KAJ9301608.1 hypothetical protein DTO217A2_7602 [Paecilomyces variotii]
MDNLPGFMFQYISTRCDETRGSSMLSVDGEPPGEDGYTPDSIDCEHCAICHFPGILHILLSIVDAEQGFLSPVKASVVRPACGTIPKQQHVYPGLGLSVFHFEMLLRTSIPGYQSRTKEIEDVRR